MPFVCLALSLGALLRGRAAHAAPPGPGDLEITVTSEALAFVSDTVAATTPDGVAFTPGVRVGYRPIDALTVIVGWRALTALTRSSGYDLTTDGDAIVAAARWSFGLHDVLDVHVELDLEAMHADFALELAGRRGTTSAWAFGAVPKVVGSARWDLDALALELRLFAGFAARTNLHADGLHLASMAMAQRTTPRDLGRLNLSGVVFGTNLAVTF